MSETSLKPVLARVAQGETLEEDEAERAFGIIMNGEATPAQIAGLVMAMRLRGETVAEMTGAVRARSSSTGTSAYTQPVTFAGSTPAAISGSGFKTNTMSLS